MWRFRKLFLLIGVWSLICVWSCQNAHFKAQEAITPIELNGQQVFSDLFLGNPSQIALIGQHLIIADNSEGNLICVVDLKGDEAPQRILQKGNGPHELSYLRRFFVSEEGVSLFDLAKHTLFTYQLSDNRLAFNDSTLTNRVTISDSRVGELLPLGDRVLATGGYDDAQFCLYDQKGDSVLAFGHYPGKIGMDMDPMARFMAKQVLMMARPDNKRFAVAGTFHDQLDFYELNRQGNLKLLKAYFTNDSKMKVVTHAHGVRAQWSDETIEYYRGTYSTQEHLYLIYSGQLFRNRISQERTLAATIYVYDWEGNPTEGYKMPIEPSCIAVDEESRMLYAVITPQGEAPRLMRYQLP